MAGKNGDTIFTELVHAINMVKDDLENKGNVFSEQNLLALENLDAYIRSGAWSKAKSVEYLLKYINLNSTEAANKTGLAPTTIRTQRANASRQIRNLLGDDIIAKCLSSQENEYKNALKRIEVLQFLWKPVDEYVSNDIIDRFYTTKCKKSYELSECRVEIDVLAELSMVHVRNLLSKVDNEKMTYLVSLLMQPRLIGDDKKPNIDLLKLIRFIEYKESADSNGVLFANEMADLQRRNEELLQVLREKEKELSDAMYKIKEFEEKQQEVKNEFDDKDFFEDTTDDSSLFADTDIAQFLKNYNERQV